MVTAGLVKAKCSIKISCGLSLEGGQGHPAAAAGGAGVVLGSRVGEGVGVIILIRLIIARVLQ